MTVLRFLGNLIVFLTPAAIMSIVTWRLSRSSRDEWQLLAWAPLVPLVGWGCFIAWGVTRDPTSHNLWPFELVFWTLISTALLGLFLLGRRLAAHATTHRRPHHRRDRTT